MVAKIGGLEMTETDGSSITKAEYGSPGSVPVFEHGTLKLSQMPSILAYVINITPKYKGLTSAQKAKDLQITLMVAEVMDGGAPVFFAKDPEMKTKIGAVIDKWYPMIEGIVPADGFVNGLPFPTGADFAILMLKEGQTPYIGLNKLAEKDPWTTCPKMKKIAESTAAVPEVKAYLADCKSMKMNPMGFPA